MCISTSLVFTLTFSVVSTCPRVLQAEVIAYKESMDQLLDTLNDLKREIETRRQENEDLQIEIAKLKAQQNKATPENPAG